jgi:hypothetical protein
MVARANRPQIMRKKRVPSPSQADRSIKKVEQGDDSYQLITFDDRKTANAMLAHHRDRFERRY